MLTVNNLIGFGVGGSAPPKVTFIDTTVFYNGANNVTWTLTGVALGTPAPDRVIVLGFGGNGASPATITTVKLGGAGGTPMTVIANVTSSTAGAAMAYLLYPSGTTADVYFEFSPYAGSIAISIHTITGANPEPYFYKLAKVDPLALTSKVEADTVGIGISGGAAINAVATCTWVGLTHNETLNSYVNGVYSSAQAELALNETLRTITADWANLTTSAVGILALWSANSKYGMDVYFDKNTLLLPLSSNFTDVIGYTTTTANGNTVINNGVQLFGQNTALFDGVGDTITLTTAVSIAASEDCCLEGWIYKTAADASGYSVVFGNSTQNNQFSYDNGGAGFVSLALVGAVVLAGRNGGIQLNTWHHIAWTRQNNIWRVFVDGNQKGTVSSSSTTAFTINTIGAHGAGWEVNGRLSNLRVTKGHARYTSNFTPPAAAFPLS